MNVLVAAVLALALAGAGCVVVPAPRGKAAKHSTVSAKKCPPGHQWSDGACHSKGKGHDR